MNLMNPQLTSSRAIQLVKDSSHFQRFFLALFNFTRSEVLLHQVALQEQPHFLGPDSAAGCCGVSAVSPAVNHTVWEANYVTFLKKKFNPFSSGIPTSVEMCVLDCFGEHEPSSPLLLFAHHANC